MHRGGHLRLRPLLAALESPALADPGRILLRRPAIGFTSDPRLLRTRARLSDSNRYCLVRHSQVHPQRSTTSFRVANSFLFINRQLSLVGCPHPGRGGTFVPTIWGTCDTLRASRMRNASFRWSLLRYDRAAKNVLPLPGWGRGTSSRAGEERAGTAYQCRSTRPP